MIALMRRGLKLFCQFRITAGFFCWNDCPDEKGIETLDKAILLQSQVEVGMIALMRRGLKLYPITLATRR